MGLRKCVVCRKPLTGVRRDARTCSNACRMAFYRIKRLAVAQEQGLVVTQSGSISTDNWCFEHQIERTVCKGFKHKDS